MAKVLTHALDKNHSASLVSQSAFIVLVVMFVAFGLPLFLVIRTHNFWVNTDDYFEQPNVRHMNEIVVYV